MNKSLCDFTKSEMETNHKMLKKLTKNPTYICKKCFRATSDKDFLCKPNKIK